MFFESFGNTSAATQLDPRVRFWSFQYLWPEDTLTHISLAVAVQIVGKKLFGDVWTGQEPAVELQSSLTEVLSAAIPHADLQHGCRLAYDFNQDYRKRCPLPFNWPMPTEQEWATAFEISKRAAEESAHAYGRFFRVCDTPQKAFKYSTIHTAIRPHDGGAEEPLLREHWNSENCLCRFDCCQLDPQKFFAASAISENGWWIYVERASFEVALRGQRQADIGGASAALIADDRISPYLKTAIVMALDLGMTPDQQIDKEALLKMVPTYWSGSESLSGRDCDRIATLLRQPEGKLGRGNPRRKNLKKGVTLSP